MIEQPEKLNNQAIILASKGEYKEAIQCFKRALILERKNSLLWFNLGLTYRDNGNLSEAENALKTAHLISPDNLDCLEAYATICFTNKKFKLAYDLCEEGLSINKNSANFWNLQGAVLFNMQQYEQACECFETAISLNPFYEDALYNLQDTYAQLNNKSGEKGISARLKELNRNSEK